MAVSKRSAKIKRDPVPEAAPSKKQVKQARKEKLSKAGKIVLVVIGIAAMLLSVSAMACSGVLNQVQSQEDYKLTGGVAATVNGVNIKEDTVTEQIMSLRQSSYESDEDWATYLSQQGLTPESYRENVIDSIARQHLLTQAEKEYDITVSQDDLDEAWDEAVENYGGDEDTFVDMITQFGFTKETYQENTKSSLAQEKLREKVASVEDPTDDQIVSYINENLDTYNDARRSSHILFKVADDATDEESAEVEAKAQEVLDKLNAGEVEFADAAKEYSEDSSADDGGDVGWDKLTTFVTEYQDALSALSTGQMSGLVKTTYGYHIILCTDQFNVESVSSADEIPEAIRDAISSKIKTEEESAKYSTWLNDYIDKADIKINEMPEDAPYNVDMSKAKADEDTDSEE
ncbi:peptidylprolyl isomerase [Collinsella sp. AF08-23]|uniref:peptidylprolyl isomerase n=1 Tax=Collinsella sp. AF08-23 TaxID=2292211 RepID=UPI000E4D13B5|nr:peptidylprolyl isomerase [Collinsella sp. AF08-23]RHS41520.1 peptidylprolyl isomerase [Collinsella sp. AF08-23]